MGGESRGVPQCGVGENVDTRNYNTKNQLGFTRGKKKKAKWRSCPDVWFKRLPADQEWQAGAWRWLASAEDLRERHRVSQRLTLVCPCAGDARDDTHKISPSPPQMLEVRRQFDLEVWRPGSQSLGLLPSESCNCPSALAVIWKE